jgi:uncharacterized membrane protein
MKNFGYTIEEKIESLALSYDHYLGRVASIMVIVSIMAGLLYAVFLLEAVAQAASKTSAERQIQAISSELGVLEGQYLSATQLLTPARAAALGFVTPQDITTVVIDKAGNNLSFVGR